MCDSSAFVELQRNWRAASPGGKRPAAFGSSAPRMGLPHLANSKLMGLHDDHKPRVKNIAPPPTAAYKPTETMRIGSADGSGWTHAERTRSWTDGLRAKDRGGPIEYVTQERTRTWNENSPRALGPGSARNRRARSPHRYSRPPPPPRNQQPRRRSASAQRMPRRYEEDDEWDARSDHSAPAWRGGNGHNYSDPPSPSGRSFASDFGNGAPSHVSFNPEAETSSFLPEGDDSHGGSTAVSGKRQAFIEYWVSAVSCNALAGCTVQLKECSL